MSLKPLLAKISVLLLSLSWATSGEFGSPRLDHKTSWIGNTYAGAKKWVQQDIHAMCVTPEGTVFTNVEWEEGGGNVGEYRDGELLRYAMHTHGWGNNGGLAVAANSQHLFIGLQVGNEGGHLSDPNTWPPQGAKWYGISRRLRSDISKADPFEGGKGGKGNTLKGSFLVVAEVPEKQPGSLPGICADETRLYVSDPHGKRIRVYDTRSMKLVKEWPVEVAGPLALSTTGKLWMLERASAVSPARLVCFSREGEPLPDRIELPAEAEAFCLGSGDRVYVADNGPGQQVRIHSLNGADYRQTATFGVPGGIFAGRPGQPGDQKLNRIRALGCDAAGNLYLAHDGQSGGGGTVLESYGPAGKLRWRLFGLTFVDMADVDPGLDEDVFTKEERFRLDYSRPPGKEWTYAGYTIHPFKYPQDPRLHIWSAGAWVRRIQGKRVLFVNDMQARHLQVYRFASETEGEIAVPSVLMTGKRIESSEQWPPHQPERGAWMWTDKNGNGAFDPDEYSGEPTDAPPYQAWWVDAEGGVWVATETRGLRYFPFEKFDLHGNPIWSPARLQVFDHPAGFKQVKRLKYEPGSDVMILGGTDSEHQNQHWKPMGPVLACYDGWLRGERKLRWRITVPYARGSKGHSSCEPMGFDLAGDYVFVPYTGASKEHGVRTGHVEVFRLKDGSSAGHFEPSEEVGEIGLQDIRECLRAHRRADGEYVVFLEDDYKSKVIMYRWQPK